MFCLHYSCDEEFKSSDNFIGHAVGISMWCYHVNNNFVVCDIDYTISCV